MSLNSKLSKEHQLVYKIFQAAACNAGGYDVRADGSDEHIIIAGGAIRDLYFDRRSRDVDLYYNANRISASSFATKLKNLDIQKMATEAGFDTIEVTRLSDGSKMGRNAEEGEDWGDVSEDAKMYIDAYCVLYADLLLVGHSMTDSLLEAHRRYPQAHHYASHDARAREYLSTMMAAIQSTGKATSGSASGSKMGKAHPLKSVEEFRVVLNDWTYIDIELMGVGNDPVKYMNSHFAVKLSRAYYDGAGVHYTSDFMQDARNKTITVACPCEHARFDRLFSYYLPKMKYYFPDFEIKVDLNAMNGIR